MIEKYGTSVNFLSIFNPDRQVEFTRDIRRVYQGKAPSLGLVKTAYNAETAESWVELQLYNLSEFAGCKEKITIPQVEETARIIVESYGYLNVAELMLFCQKFKRCEYGKFYGAVDPMLILGALSDFVDERNYQLRKYEQEEEEKKKREEYAKYQAIRDSFKARVPGAWTEECVINFNDYHWGGLYKLTDAELQMALDEVVPKNEPDSVGRYQIYREVSDRIIANRGKLCQKK